MPKKLSNASSKYGAQLGRPNKISEPEYPVIFHIEKLGFHDYAYDRGGAYWGAGDPIFHAWGDGKNEEQEMFVRAKDQKDAEEQILKQFPKSGFVGTVKK